MRAAPGRPDPPAAGTDLVEAASLAPIRVQGALRLTGCAAQEQTNRRGDLPIPGQAPTTPHAALSDPVPRGDLTPTASDHDGSAPDPQSLVMEAG